MFRVAGAAAITEGQYFPSIGKRPTDCRRRGVNWTALYELADQGSIQVAFTSGEAERARQDWERWLPHVTDLSVEVYAALSPIPGYEHWN